MCYFLCARAPAEHKAVLKYYPWCSQWDLGHFCLGFSDLRSHSHINQCQKIISCHEGRVSAHSRWQGWWSSMSWTNSPTTPCTDVWGFTIQHVAEHLLSIFFPYGAGQGAFYPFISKPGPPIILILRGGFTLEVTLLVIQFRAACVVLTKQMPSPPPPHPLSCKHKTHQPKTLFYI